ncbi:hypothetical protein ACFYO2_05005 [Streptomyces sp. NPDC006602]|uniref:hypothetical protein n=1 Tax=Streptomyces sp. NPDC006602 TaxID=3364751 RepID=UPI003673FE36
MRPEELRYPVIVVDDDQWMYVYSSPDQLVQDIEPTFLDDITATFDGLARPLRIALDESGEGVFAELRSSDSVLSRLQDDPPERLTDPREYTTSVSQAYERKRERRKKRA